MPRAPGDDMPLQRPDLWLGTAALDPPDPVIAGSLGSWTIRYRVGRYGFDDTGSIKIAFRMVCDWEAPQVSEPTAPGYCTAVTTGNARLAVHVDPYGGVRPWSRVLWIYVRDGTLVEGDEVTIILGDRSGGSPGMRAQTYSDEQFEFRILVDCFGTGQFQRLPASPSVAVVPGPAHRLVLTAPSDAVVGEPVALHIRAIDRWGNCTAADRGTVLFGGAAGLPERFDFSATDRGVHRFVALRLEAPGVQRVLARDDHGRAAASNPIRCHAERPRYRRYWGDTQGQSGATVGTGGVEAFFRHARDVAAIDFVVHSANDFQITREHWEETLRHVRAFHQPGRFVTFPSFEWSGNYGGGGDHNVVFRGDDAVLHRSSHWQLDDWSDADADRYPIGEVWRSLQGRDDVLGIPHVGGRRSNFALVVPAFCPVIEIASVHGRFEWFAREALARRLIVGFVGASDDHSGRPGDSPATAAPFLPKRGGLTAVLAPALTREAIWDALWARRCYATTGERILLDVQADGQPMGSILHRATAPVLTIAVVGTGPLDRITVLRNTDEVHFVRLGRPGKRLRIAWSGLRNDMRGRYVRWDGGLTLSAGRIAQAESYAFDTPLAEIGDRTERSVRWRSGTAGDFDGVILTIEAPEDAEIRFATGPATFSFKPAGIGADPFVVEAGGLDRRVTVERIPDEETASEITVQYQDPAPAPGTNAYWVRVLQADGEMAWSSPIYVVTGE